MGKLRIASINICGLNDPVKRRRINQDFRILKADIICLQETHIEAGRSQIMNFDGYQLISWTMQDVRTRGVAIFARRGLANFPRSLTDKFGRWVILQCLIDNCPFTLCSVYGPVLDDPEMFNWLNLELVGWPLPIILCGDFNINLSCPISNHPEIGYQGRKIKVYKSLSQLKEFHGLIDVWAQLERDDPGFTYFSAPHRTHARLDYFFTSQCMVQGSKITKFPRVMSDHNPLVLEVNINRKTQITCWTFNRALLNDSSYIHHMERWIPKFIEENLGSTSIQNVWDTLKAGIRGETIKYGWETQKEEKSKINVLYDTLGEAETNLAKVLSEGGDVETAQTRITIAKSAITEISLTKSAGRYLAWRSNLYESNERVGHMLAVRAREKEVQTRITEILDPDIGLVNDPETILLAFQKFYQKLYTEDIKDNCGVQEDIERYLEEITLGKLTSQDKTILEAPIRLEELQIAIESLPAGKAVGTDFLPGEFYKRFRMQLISLLFEMFSIVQGGEVPPDSWKIAKIVVFLKKGKIATDPGSYRPITLINSDTKIYSKIFANRLALVIKKLVSPQQHGFVPGRETIDHIRRTIALFDYTKVTGDPMALILLDAEKAFDRVSWPFLWAVMAKKGIGNGFIRAIQSMYKEPTARIAMMGASSGLIKISRGTRQGCPCSPLLFAIYIDPLIRKILGNQRIQPVYAKEGDVKILAYADDLAIITPAPSHALEEINNLTIQFGKISGYHLNEHKTQIVINDKIILQDHRIAQSARYLGIEISSKVEDIVDINFNPLIQKIKADSQRINNLHLTLIGRSNVIKMIFLPKILYYFRAIPLEINKFWFFKLNQIVSWFLWAGQRPRRALKYMTLTRDRGGWSVPNFQIYYWASALKQMAELLKGENLGFGEVSIYRLIYGVEAKGLLMRHIDYAYFKRVKFKVLLGAFRVWTVVRKKFLIGRIHRYSPLDNNKLLPEIFQDAYFKNWNKKGILFIDDLISDTGIFTFDSIKEKFGIGNNYFFKYLQIRDFLTKKVISCNRIPLLDLILGGRSTMSMLYKLINKGMGDDMSKHLDRWQVTLQAGQGECEDSLLFSQTACISASLQVQCFKTWCNLYITPARIYRWGGTSGIHCSRCGLLAADSIHMFATCLSLSQLLIQIEQRLDSILGYSIVLTPQVILLGISNQEMEESDRKLVYISMAVLRLCLASIWLDQNPPSIHVWFGKLLSIYKWEISVFRRRGIRARVKGLKIWEPLTRWLNKDED